MPDYNEAKFLKPNEIFKEIKIEQGMHVADFGCGNLGYFIIPLAKLIGNKGIAYAVDIMKPALDGVKSRAKMELVSNIQLVWGNIEQKNAVNIPEKSLDISLLINVLYQNKDHQTIFAEVNRLLKPAGSLIVIDWKKTNVVFGPSVETRLDPQTVTVTAQQAGFELVKQLDYEYFWGLVFAKK